MAKALSASNGSHSISGNLETYSLIWLNHNGNNDEEEEKIEQDLRKIINHLTKFDNEYACQQYIEERLEQDRLILIVNDLLSYTLVPRIHQLRQVYSIYIYCKSTLVNQEWINKFNKIKAVAISFEELITQIKSDHKKRMKDEQSLLINIFSNGENADKSTTGLNGQFVYFQLLIDCLLRMKSSEQDKNELISICRTEYQGNNSYINQLHEFQNDYSPDKVLWWYTRDSFFYKVLNKALRVQNIEILFLFRSYISDIHDQLQKSQSKTSIRIYRSQLMAKEEIYSLKKNIGQLISVNSFLSTTVQRETALFFMGEGNPEDNLQRVLFEIDADPHIVSTKPFADITSHSDFPIETEVLFMLGSIFRLNNITLEDDQLWVIKMTLCSDDEHDLKHVLTHMKDQNGNGETDLCTLAKIVWKMGKFNLAEKYYHRLINEIPLNDPYLIKLYEDLSNITSHKGDYDASILWYNKALEMRQKYPLYHASKSTKTASALEFIDYQNPQLEQIIAQSHNRSRINLDEEKLIDQDMTIVVKQAIINKQCAKLSLSSNSITPKGALILASGLKNNSILQRLHLGCTRIGDLGAQYIAKAISNNNNVLKILNLSFTGITDDGAEHLAVMLKTNKTLTHLFLYNNEISDEGVAMVANALQNHNDTLEYLDLSYNKRMTDLSVAFLIEMITYTRTLKMISVDNMKILLIILMIITQTLTVSYNQPKFCPMVDWDSNATTLADNNTIDEGVYSIFVDNNNTVYVPAPTRKSINIWRNANFSESKNVHANFSFPISVFVNTKGDLYTYNLAYDHKTDGATRNHRFDLDKSRFWHGTVGWATGWKHCKWGWEWYKCDDKKPSNPGGSQPGSNAGGGQNASSTSDNQHDTYGEVYKWTLNNTLRLSIKRINETCSNIFIDINNTLYCSMEDHHQVVKSSLDTPPGKLITVAGTAGSNGSSSDTLNYPCGIFVDENVDLYVADSANHRIQLFKLNESNGSTIVQNQTVENLSLSYPTGVILDGDKSLFIVDSGNHRIVMWKAPSFRCLVGCSTGNGSASNQLLFPTTLNFDNQGNMFVVDTGNSRIQEFSLATNSCAESTTTSVSSASVNGTGSAIGIRSTSIYTINGAVSFQAEDSTTSKTTVVTSLASHSHAVPSSSVSHVSTIDKITPSYFVAPVCNGTTLTGFDCAKLNSTCDVASPCQNNGSCKNDHSIAVGYFCSCPLYFNGSKCQNDHRPCKWNTCLNNGTCDIISNTTFSCTCQAGWQGDHCESKIDYCKNKKCENNGVCRPLWMDFICECLTDSYSGRYCEIVDTKIILTRFFSKSLAYIAIIAMLTVAIFIITMDMLKYCFGIDLTRREMIQYQREKQARKRKRAIRQRIDRNKLSTIKAQDSTIVRATV